MRISRLVSLWRPAAAVLLAATVAVACDDATAPPGEGPEVRVEAITATALSGTVGADVEPAPAVRVTDELDRPLAGVAVRFQVGAGSGTTPGATVTTSADGTASVGRWTLGPLVGSHTLTAGVGGRADVVFTADAAAGPLGQLTPVSGMDQVAGSGERLSSPLLVQAADGFGNPLAGVTIEFSVIAGRGSIAGATAVTDAGGHAVSGAWTLGATGGPQEVRAAAEAVQTTFRAIALPPAGPLAGRIAFESWSDPFIDIAVVNADGSGFTRLVNPGFDFQPAWSPDGTRLAAVAGQSEQGNIVYTMTAAGEDRSPVSSGPQDGGPAWSPDGSTIAFSSLREGSFQIAALGVADGMVSAVVDERGYNSQPAWSPDGQRLAFVSDYEAFDFVSDIYVVNADGTGRRQLTQGFGYLNKVHYYLHPAWSPDGSLIAFVHGSPMLGRDMRFTVELMSPDGVVLKTLARAGDLRWEEVLDPGSLAWSPDGTGIAYTFVDCDLLTGVGCAGGRSVKYVSLDGSRELTIVADARNPSWTR